MAMKTETISRSYSVFNQFFLSLLVISASGFGKGILDNYYRGFETPIYSTMTVQDSTDSMAIVYHGRPLVMSLVVPGLGQYYNREAWWRTSLFAGIELFGLYSYWNWSTRAEDIRINYEKYADQHWTLENFITNTPVLGVSYADVRFGGTHHLILELNGVLIAQDTLGQLGNDPGLIVLRDRDFYENIGKYDQFVGGWDDVYDQDGNPLYWEKQKDVGDSTEILIMTRHRDNYLSQRAKNNSYLKMAKFAVSAIMFNHVASAFEALWSSNRNSIERRNKVKPTMGLIYDRKAPYGIGGIAFALTW
ncbi:MAG: hypothetical protein GXO90_06440 [FCB group bacterium]|nr:hypothetical protein [FCB group bacterium]